LLTTAVDCPFAQVQLDHIGPLLPSQGFRYILVMMDRWSRWIRLAPSKSTSAEETAAVLARDWIASYGPPVALLADGGPEFKNQLVERLCRILDINLHITTPAHPQSHGPIERANETIGATLRSMLRDEPEWTRLLPAVQFIMNSSSSRAIGCSPFEALHGVKPRTVMSDALGLTATPVPEPLEQAALLANSKLRKTIADTEKRVHDEAVRRAAKRARGRVDFSPGDYVLVFSDCPRHKLDRRWDGPFLIDSKLTPVTYLVRSLVDDSTHRVHVNRLHHFDSTDLSPAQLHSEARHSEDFDIAQVIGHRVNDRGQLILHVVWDGYEDYGEDDERSWVPWSDCMHQQTVIDYIREHGLKVSKE
jgi:transposase InsO family protein